MNATKPSVPVPAVIDPADIELPPTQPIDITALIGEPLNHDPSQ